MVSLVAQPLKNLSVMWRSRFDSFIRKIPWRRKWQPTPVLLPGEFHGQRRLVGYSPWGSQKVSHNWATNTHTDTQTHTHTHTHTHFGIKCDHVTFYGEGNGTHSRTLAWKIPWTEDDPGGPQSMGSLRVGHDWATSLSLFTFMHWRRKWQPIPVFLPGESQGRGSLVGCRLWGSPESDMTEAT